MDTLTNAIDQAIATKDYTTLRSIFCNTGGNGSNTWQSVGPGEQRTVAAYFLHKIVTTTTTTTPDLLSSVLQSSPHHAAILVPVLTTTLSHLPAVVEGAADNKIREILFNYYVADEEYVIAARTLATMRMEDDMNSVYYTTAADKTNLYVRIAECFLAADEVSEADSAVNRAGMVIEQIPDKDQHAALILRYKSTYARVLDCNRKFIQAATRYHELSQSTYTNIIDADDLFQMLGRAVTCAILAPSGPQRSRVIQSIVNDTRLDQLTSLDEFSTHATILRKMYTNQILYPTELKIFEAGLADHQKAIRGDGYTILERSIIEHNMIAVSNLYESIYTTELATLLGVTTSTKAEKIAAAMITDGTLLGSLDQVDGLLQFDPTQSPTEAWDESITHFCNQLNAITDAIKVSSN